MKGFQNTVQVLFLSTFFAVTKAIKKTQASYMQYPDLYPFYFCDAITRANRSTKELSYKHPDCYGKLNSYPFYDGMSTVIFIPSRTTISRSRYPVFQDCFLKDN